MAIKLKLITVEGLVHVLGSPLWAQTFEKCGGDVEATIQGITFNVGSASYEAKLAVSTMMTLKQEIKDGEHDLPDGMFSELWNRCWSGMKDVMSEMSLPVVHFGDSCPDWNPETKDTPTLTPKITEAISDAANQEPDALDDLIVDDPSPKGTSVITPSGEGVIYFGKPEDTKIGTVTVPKTGVYQIDGKLTMQLVAGQEVTAHEIKYLSDLPSIGETPKKKVKVSVKKAVTYPLDKLETGNRVKLISATKMYQPVKGSSGSSRYFLIARSDDLKVAVRIKEYSSPRPVRANAILCTEHRLYPAQA